MKITTVHYSALINLGDYNNEKIGLTAEVKEDESVEEVIAALKEKVKTIAGPNAEELYNSISERRRALNELERKLKKATEQWEATAEFLRAQGIKPDAPNIPDFTRLLPEIKEEYSRVSEAEIVEADENRQF